jgi:hypothetical protein
MTKLEIRQQMRNEALNKIRKIYNPKYKFNYDQYDEDSYSEQREKEIRLIIENLEKDLKNTKCDYETYSKHFSNG